MLFNLNKQIAKWPQCPDCGIDMQFLMSERAKLLRVAGAAAQFVAGIESRSLPERMTTEAEILAESVNALPEDTLKDALVQISTTTTA